MHHYSPDSLVGARLEQTDDEQKTALFNAARIGGPEATDVLLELGAKVDAKGDYSTTPLIGSQSGQGPFC